MSCQDSSQRSDNDNVTTKAEDEVCINLNSSQDTVSSQNHCSRDTQVNSYSYPTPILFDELIARARCYQATCGKDYEAGIVGLGVSHCLSYIAYFCRFEGRKRGFNVVSVASDDGFFDKEIVTDFYSHFAEKLEIVPVNANPEANSEFKTVDDLIKKRPNIVGNCILLLIWPKFLKAEEKITEIDVIRKLQPRAVLTVYEEGGMCGSADFRAYLRGDKDYSGWDRYTSRNHGLDNYAIKELGHQEVVFEAGQKFVVPGSEPAEEIIMKRGTRAFEFKITQLMRTDCDREDLTTMCSTTDV